MTIIINFMNCEKNNYADVLYEWNNMQNNNVFV